MTFGTADDLSGGPTEWLFQIGRYYVVRTKDAMQVLYDANTVKIPLFTVVHRGAKLGVASENDEGWVRPLLPPSDTVYGVYFVKRANVMSSSSSDVEGEQTGELSPVGSVREVAWKKYFKKGLDDIPESELKVNLKVKEGKRSKPAILVYVRPYFTSLVGLVGGTTYTAPTISFQIVDMFGANVTPSILHGKPTGAVVYDGVSGALGYGVMKTGNVANVASVEKESNVDALQFATIVRAFSAGAKVNTPYYFITKLTMFFKDWVVIVGYSDYNLLKPKASERPAND